MFKIWQSWRLRNYARQPFNCIYMLWRIHIFLILRKLKIFSVANVISLVHRILCEKLIFCIACRYIFHGIDVVQINKLVNVRECLCGSTVLYLRFDFYSVYLLRSAALVHLLENIWRHFPFSRVYHFSIKTTNSMRERGCFIGGLWDINFSSRNIFSMTGKLFIPQRNEECTIAFLSIL